MVLLGLVLFGCATTALVAVALTFSREEEKRRRHFDRRSTERAVEEFRLRRCSNAELADAAASILERNGWDSATEYGELRRLAADSAASANAVVLVLASFSGHRLVQPEYERGYMIDSPFERTGLAFIAELLKTRAGSSAEPDA